MFDHCLYFNTTALARQLERIWSEAFKPFDLTPPQAFTLRAVLERPGMLHSELSDTLKIARATTTRAVDSSRGDRPNGTAGSGRYTRHKPPSNSGTR